MSSVLVVGLFIVTFCMQAFEIPSSSMENTLLIGDHVFVDRVVPAPPTSWMRWIIPYRDIHRGQIIVFYKPSEPDLHLVKRVIGVPGDRIHLEHGSVYRNGQKLDEPYVFQTSRYEDYGEEFPSLAWYASHQQIPPEWQVSMPLHVQNGDLVVPPGSYFAMGDHRDVSLDSRYWGFVPRENIIGTPRFIYWSFETPGDQWQKTAMVDRIGFIFHIAIHFFDQTRWRRMFRLVH